jgi:hypothetical protein
MRDTPQALALITLFVGCASKIEHPSDRLLPANFCSHKSKFDRLLKNVLDLKVEDAEAVKLEDKTAIVPPLSIPFDEQFGRVITSYRIK